MLLVLACASAPAPPAPLTATVHAPSEGATYAHGPIPLEVGWPLGDSEATVHATLNGAPLETPLALLHQRRGETRWIAELDTTQLDPGPHTLEVQLSVEGEHELTARSTFTWAPGPLALTLSVTDDSGTPQWARVVLHDADGPLALAGPDAQRDRYQREGARSSVVVPAAPLTVHLEPGTYTVLATRGIRETTDLRTLTLAADTALELVVETAVPTPGRIAADLHVHTGRSPDSHITDAARLRTLLASGLDAAVLTDHSKATTLPTRPGITTITGAEFQLQKEGRSAAHLNAFPMNTGTVERVPWQTAGTVVGQMAQLTSGLVQLNHPRGVVFQPQANHRPRRPLPYIPGTTRSTATLGHAIFSNPGFERSVPPGEGVNDWMTAPDPTTGATLLDIDAMEILNRHSFAMYQEIRADWFALMNAGWFITGTANSDSHAEAIEQVGYPLNLVTLDGPLTGDALASAVASGQVCGTNGPLLTLDHADGIATATVAAAPWVPVPEVRLVVDGAVVATEALGWDGLGESAQQATLQWPIDGGRWLLVEAGWPLDGLPADPEALPPAWRMAVPEHVPVAFTNPVRLSSEQ